MVFYGMSHPADRSVCGRPIDSMTAGTPSVKGSNTANWLQELKVQVVTTAMSGH